MARQICWVHRHELLFRYRVGFPDVNRVAVSSRLLLVGLPLEFLRPQVYTGLGRHYSETLPVEHSPEPVTTEAIASDLRALGVERGETLLVHASLSALGWISGGPPAVVDGLQERLGPSGTLVMPAHSSGNMDPAEMEHLPVPESWYNEIRELMPPYRPAITPTQGAGAIPECFRSHTDGRKS